jgi:hypothetical protein
MALRGGGEKPLVFLNFKHPLHDISSYFRPKNFGPDHTDPVMVRAMTERLR